MTSNAAANESIPCLRTAELIREKMVQVRAESCFLEDSKDMLVCSSNDSQGAGVAQTSLPPTLQGHSPTNYWEDWYRPFGVVFVALVIVAMTLLATPLVPFVILGTLYRRFKAQFVTYHTPPSTVKIAIVGGGWGGLQLLQRLKELGVEHATVFERLDDVGGTWHPNNCYHGQQLHSPHYMTAFQGFVEKQNVNMKFRGTKLEPSNSIAATTTNECHISGDEYQSYMKRYVNAFGLAKHIKYNARVLAVRQETGNTKTTATLEVDYNGDVRTEGPFDLVIYTSISCDKIVPHFKGQESFQGNIIHGQDLKADVVSAIIEQKRKVAVIGGSKMAIDLLRPFLQVGYNNVALVYRNAYLFLKFETSCPPQSYSLGHFLLGVCNIFSLVMCPLSLQVARWMFWCSNVVWTYDTSRPMDIRKFKLGVVCPVQRNLLSKMRLDQMHKSGIAEFSSDGVQLLNGDFVKCDVALLGTSYSTGLDKVRFFKDGTQLDLQGLNNGTGPRMLNYFSMCEMSTFALSGASYTTFGPIARTSVAELAVYHLCVQNQNLSSNEMERIRQWQIGFGRGTQSGNVTGRFLLYSDNFLPDMISSMFGMVFSGLLDITELLQHMIYMLCFGIQLPVKMDILPQNAQGVKGGQGTAEKKIE